MKWSGHLIFSGSRGFGVGLSTLLSSGLLALIAVLSLPPCLITGSTLCLQSDTRKHTHTITYSSSHTPINDTLNAHLHIDLHVSSRAPTHKHSSPGESLIWQMNKSLQQSKTRRKGDRRVCGGMSDVQFQRGFQNPSLLS